MSGIPAGQAGRHQLIQWYYAPSPLSAADLALLRWIDELYVKHPLAGALALMCLLKREDIVAA